jgi:hypothetical protein
LFLRGKLLKSSFDIYPTHCFALPSSAVASVVAMPVFVVVVAAAAVVVVALQASRKQSTRLYSPVFVV